MIRFDAATLKQMPHALGAEKGEEDNRFAQTLAATETARHTPSPPDNAEKIAAHNAAVLAMVGAVPDAKQEFLDFMEKTPMERMREQMLRVLGLTEEDVAAMTPEERQAVEEQIAAMIKENARQELEAQAEGGQQQDRKLNL